ncbi:WD40-repeat-containing domain protein [Trichophaea hybrida]|nr:WD40-repeat-containing domain protein [Trichophaea hybrida]
MPQKALPATAPPPPKPAYILRGHLTPIHAITFLSKNQYLLTADTSGICILWLLTTRRPVAVWNAHTSSILSVAEWSPCDLASPDRRIITHGRDNRVRVWKLPRPEDDVCTTLPADEGRVTGKAPWMVASLEVNALNFCGFGFCQDQEPTDDATEYRDVLIAVPSALDSQTVDIFTLPSTRRVHTRISPLETTGMAMALALRYVEEGALTLIAGYESGHVFMFHRIPAGGKWEVTYSSQPHSQPILSLAVQPDEGEIVKLDTKHSGLQSVCVRSDGKVFATAGWDGRFRVFKTKGMKEVAVLKWHTVGCYAVTFAEVLEEEGEGEMSVEVARVRRETRKHWVAGGAKDGKVSLWEVF